MFVNIAERRLTMMAEYENTVLAGKENGIFHQNIRFCCLNPNRTAGGFKWRFANE